MTFLVYGLVALVFFTYLRQRHVKVLRKMFVTLGFVFSLCGLTHLVGALMFVWPAYWFDAHVRLLSGLVGLTALALIVWNLPRIMRMPRAGKESQLYEEILKLRHRLTLMEKDRASDILSEVIEGIRIKG